MQTSRVFFVFYLRIKCQHVCVFLRPLQVTAELINELPLAELGLLRGPRTAALIIDWIVRRRVKVVECRKASRPALTHHLPYEKWISPKRLYFTPCRRIPLYAFRRATNRRSNPCYCNMARFRAGSQPCEQHVLAIHGGCDGETHIGRPFHRALEQIRILISSPLHAVPWPSPIDIVIVYLEEAWNINKEQNGG